MTRTSSCSSLLPTFERLDIVLDDALAALETAPPHALHKLEVALAAQKVST